MSLFEIKKYWKILSQLGRFNLSLAIAFSSLAGFFAARHPLSPAFLFLLPGTFLLSVAASALNQIQEREWDALMPRTQTRPLPSKQISPKNALIYSLAAGFLGLVILLAGTSPLAAALGAFNLIWYNAVYTPLKRKTPYALWIGAFTGAIPPVMGWNAAGGNISDPGILVFALFMFFWQIPHFILLLLEYGKEYRAAGFPSIQESKSPWTLFLWLAGSLAVSLLFPFFGLIRNYVLIALLILFDSFLTANFARTLFLVKKQLKLQISARLLYFYEALIFGMIILDSFLKRTF